MAARPKSATTMADCDVNLDFLTKEEREALLSKKMDMIRQRNKAISERHEMIQADKRKAEESGNAVKALDSKTLPAEGGNSKARGRGRGQSSHKDGNRSNKERPKSHGDFRDTSAYEPVVDVSELNNHRGDFKGKGSRGGQYHLRQDQENDVGSTPKNRRRPPPKDESFHQGHQNRGSRQNSHKAGPPPDPSFNPLADRRRSSEKKEGQDHKRHPRNYGGGADLSRVKETMKSNREKERDRPSLAKPPPEIAMTGRERKNHQDWKQERDRYDKERIQRQMGEGGNWRREWDNDKVVLEYDDLPKVEPAKRPAGRIGSGRFDRGERDERSRGGVPQQQAQNNHQPHSPPSPSSSSSSHQPPQGTGSSMPSSSPLSPQPQTSQPHGDPRPGGTRNSGGRGRGRGRGRAKGAPGPLSGGDKSPRPRTWSGGDDRLVECQKELLLVKFDNIAGDNTVEVEYDDDDDQRGHPHHRPRSKSGSNSSSSQGNKGYHGGGRNAQSQAQKHQPRGGGGGGGGGKGQQPQNQSKSNKSSKGRAGGGMTKSSSHHDHQFMDADSPVNGKAASFMPHSKSEEFRTARPTSSHSQSYGDSEEWEDCTGSSSMQEDDDDDYANMAYAGQQGQQDLHLECQLNPEAPEFLPTSPDFMKTPPGHVKVLNWAATGSNSPTSPRSASLTSPPGSYPSSVTSPLVTTDQPLLISPASGQSSRPKASAVAAEQGCGDAASSTSSPGSSVSTRAKNRREECDTLPEPDEPCPPPFLLEGGPMNEGNKEDEEERKAVGNDKSLELDREEEDEDAEAFEDSVDAIPVSDKQEKPEQPNVSGPVNGISEDVPCDRAQDNIDLDAKSQPNVPLEPAADSIKDEQLTIGKSESNEGENHNGPLPQSQERQPEEVNSDSSVGEGEDPHSEREDTPVANADVHDPQKTPEAEIVMPEKDDKSPPKVESVSVEDTLESQNSSPTAEESASA